jgi:hypothetical protein
MHCYGVLVIESFLPKSFARINTVASDNVSMTRYKGRTK